MYTYKTSGVCSSQITFDVNNNNVTHVKFTGGCQGNTQGVALLAEGRNIDDVINLLSGVNCGGKGTSCPDQLAKALIKYKKEQLA